VRDGRRVRIPAAWCDDPHSKYAQFDGRPVRDFVPLFVERYARAELAKLAAYVTGNLSFQRLKHPFDGVNVALGMADGAPHSTRCPYVPRRHALG